MSGPKAQATASESITIRQARAFLAAGFELIDPELEA